VGGATYSWTGPNSFSSALQNPSIAGAVVADAGTYSVTVTVSGCTSAAGTTAVVVDSTPIPVAGSNSPVCVGSPLNLTATNIGGASYSWTGPNGFTSSVQNPVIASASTLNGGTYYVNATLAGCVSGTDSVVVIINSPAIVNAGSNQTVCANMDSVYLSGSCSTGSGSWSTSGSGTFFPNANTLNAVYIISVGDISSGSITLTLSSGNNGACSVVTSNMSVTITPAPTVNAGSDQSVCSNNANVSLSGTSSTGTGTWTTSGSGTFSPNNTTLNAVYIPSSADTAAGTDTLILTSTSNGVCNPAVDTMIVIYTPAPYVNAGGPIFICGGTTSVALNGSVSGGASTGQWSTLGTGTFSPNNTTLNATYNLSPADISSGTVTLVLTSTGNGSCLAVTDTSVITITTVSTAFAGNDTTICASNTLQLNGIVTGGSGTGQWSTTGSGAFVPNATTLNAVYIPSNADTAAKSVKLILTTTLSCAPMSDTMVVTFTPAPAVNAGAPIFICTGTTTANLNGSVTGGTSTGQWSTLGSGTFTPNNTTLNATYNLSPADITAGTVSLVLTSTNNGSCSAATDTVVITITTVSTAFAGNDTSICANGTLQLNGIVTGGLGTGQWSTTGSGVFTPSVDSLDAVYIPSNADTAAGTVKLILTTTQTCAPMSDTMVLTFNPAPAVSAGPPIFICQGITSANLNGSVSGGASTGQWSTLGSGSFSPNNTTLNATYNLSPADITAGTVSLVLTSTNNGSCSAVTDTVVITITTVSTAFAGNDTNICANTTLQLHGVITGGAGTGQWSTLGSGTFTPNADSLDAIYTPSSSDTTTGSVRLVLTTTQSCSPMSDTMLVTFIPAPVAMAGPDQTVCSGTTVSLNGLVTGASGGIWNTLGDGTFSPNSSTLNAVYTLGATDISNGTVSLVLTTTGSNCTAGTDTIKVNINILPVANFTSTKACAGTIVSFRDTSSISTGSITSVSWNFGNAISSLQDPTDTFNTGGSHNIILVATSNTGCSDTLKKSIYVNELPIAKYKYTTYCTDSVHFADSSFVTGGSVSAWMWSFGDSTHNTSQNTTHTYATTGSYYATLIVVSDSGCVSSITDTLNIQPCPPAGPGTPGIPTAFTPNGDGVNDVLLVKGGPFTSFDFRVFDKWGIQLFESVSQDVGWNGYYNSVAQPDGTYTWTFAGTTVKGQQVKITGNVTLIR
jgi:gliding motility-associated-like protein